MTDKRRVIALGFFDGVHIGHAALLRRARAAGAEEGLIPSVVTFDAHPRSLVTGRKTKLINSAEDRAGLIQRIFGIDDVIFLHFDRELARMPWDEYIERLASEFGARRLVAGHNFRFGRSGAGDAECLARKCAELGIGCDIIPPVSHLGVVSSSTGIRKLLADGDIKTANEYLGHRHVLTDYVRYGYRLGRELGTPTINMTFGDGVLVPAHGVYAARVYLEADPAEGGAKIGVTNIGTRPTVSGGREAVTAETHILDFRGNLYGRTVRLEFCERTRPEMKFDGTDALRGQILRDCGEVREYFGRNP
ncbi:MAG: riboflavin biosynthesis protein RibF [Oscillospiraceae bacterium]|jgi:riboflavin kinase/FMN adenylyltransferase|nr:riboflavin biosynthesis protein RibF [Oscillospiraceae bacterium]